MAKLWLQPRRRPVTGGDGIAFNRNGSFPMRPVVYSTRATHPALHRRRPEPVPPPVRRAWNLDALTLEHERGQAQAEVADRGHHAVEQGRAGPNRLALIARPGSDAALPSAAVEICVRLGCGRTHHAAFDADLLVGVIPEEHNRCVRVRIQFGSLATVVVGVKVD